MTLPLGNILQYLEILLLSQLEEVTAATYGSSAQDSPTTNNYLAQNVSIAEVEKSCYSFIKDSCFTKKCPEFHSKKQDSVNTHFHMRTWLMKTKTH